MRINVVDVRVLADQHLIAEYNEINGMMLAYYRRSRVAEGDFDMSRISSRYTLNTGHAIFFYNKMLFVKKRFSSIVSEMQDRGFKPQILELDYSSVREIDMNDNTVTLRDIMINLERIEQRISLKPEWYKYRGETCNFIELYTIYKKEINEII